MTAIIEWLLGLVDIILALIQLLVTTLHSATWLVMNLPQLVAGVTAGFAYTPDFLFPFLSASVSLLVVFAVIRML